MQAGGLEFASGEIVGASTLPAACDDSKCCSSRDHIFGDLVKHRNGSNFPSFGRACSIRLKSAPVRRNRSGVGHAVILFGGPKIHGFCSKVAAVAVHCCVGKPPCSGQLADSAVGERVGFCAGVGGQQQTGNEDSSHALKDTHWRRMHKMSVCSCGGVCGLEGPR